jgi:hypothetical protein
VSTIAHVFFAYVFFVRVFFVRVFFVRCRALAATPPRFSLETFPPAFPSAALHARAELKAALGTARDCARWHGYRDDRPTWLR